MTNEQTIDEIIAKAAAVANESTPPYLVGLLGTLTVQLRSQAAALAAKDEAMSVMEAEAAAMSDALKRIAEAMGLGIGHTAEEIVAAVVALQPIKASPEPGEWIEWKGGECPIADGVQHQVRLRIGDVLTASRAVIWDWWHDKCDGDIIAYRIIP